MLLKKFKLPLVIVMLVQLAGCVPSPIGAFQLSKTNLEDRRIQSRDYQGINEESILSASAAVLQDMGYTITESETRLGVISASKHADATDGVQVTLAVLSALLGGRATDVDDVQKFNATVVVLPKGNTNNYTVRMTMQRIVWNTAGRITRMDVVRSKDVYQAFFEKLSKSVFLERNI